MEFCLPWNSHSFLRGRQWTVFQTVRDALRRKWQRGGMCLARLLAPISLSFPGPTLLSNKGLLWLSPNKVPECSHDIPFCLSPWRGFTVGQIFWLEVLQCPVFTGTMQPNKLLFMKCNKKTHWTWSISKSWMITSWIDLLGFNNHSRSIAIIAPVAPSMHTLCNVTLQLLTPTDGT